MATATGSPARTSGVDSASPHTRRKIYCCQPIWLEPQPKLEKENELMNFSRAALWVAIPLSVIAPSVWAGELVPFYSNVSKPVFQEWQQELRDDRVL